MLKDLGGPSTLSGGISHIAKTGYSNQPNSLSRAVIELIQIPQANSSPTPFLSDIKLHTAEEKEDILYTNRYLIRQALGILNYTVYMIQHDSTQPKQLER